MPTFANNQKQYISELGDKLSKGLDATNGRHVKTIAPVYYEYTRNGSTGYNRIDQDIDAKADKNTVASKYQAKLYYWCPNGAPFGLSLDNVNIPNFTTSYSAEIPIKFQSEQLYLPGNTFFSGTVYLEHVYNGDRARTCLSVLANGIEIAWNEIPVNKEHSNTTLWCPVSYYNSSSTGQPLSVKLGIDPGAEVDAQSSVVVDIRGCVFSTNYPIIT